MSKFLIHNDKDYMLIFQQKIASTSLHQLLHTHKGIDSIPYVHPPIDILEEDGWVYDEYNPRDWEGRKDGHLHQQTLNDFRMVLRGESTKKLLILTRAPLKKHISGIVQDSVVNYTQKSIAELSELIEKNCVLADTIVWKTFLRSNKIQNKEDLKKHLWDKLNDNRRTTTEELTLIFSDRETAYLQVFRILLRAIFAVFFSDPTQTVYSNHRMPYNSVLAIITRYVDKKNMFVFDIDTNTELEVWLTEHTGEDFYYELSHSNAKSRMNSIVEIFLKEEFPWKYKEILDLVRTELYGHTILKSFRNE